MLTFTSGAPKASAPGMAAVTLMPFHTTLRALIADAWRSALVIWFQFLPVVTSRVYSEKMSGRLELSVPVDSLAKLAKPRPWPNSCSSTEIRLMSVPWLVSSP